MATQPHQIPGPGPFYHIERHALLLNHGHSSLEAVVRFQLRSIEKDGALGPSEFLYTQFPNLDEAVKFFRRLADRLEKEGLSR